MARKSSKTARVMNLLANGESADPESTKEEAAEVNRDATESAEAPQSIKELTVLAQKASIQSQESGISPISIIDMSASAPDPVAELIREKLEEEEAEQTEAVTVPQSSQDIDEHKHTAPAQKVDAVSQGGTDMAENDTLDGGYIQDDESGLHGDLTSTGGETPDGSAVSIDGSTGSMGSGTSNLDDGADSIDGATNNLDDSADSIDDGTDSTGDNTADVTNNQHQNPPSLEPSAEAVPVTAAAEMAEAISPEPVAPAAAEPEKPHIEEYQYLNVMERLVKEKVLEYMNKFDVCTCDRCVADTTALTLSHLPPKYLVVHPSTAAPLLNFYSNKFSQQVIVELTKACTIVKGNPHH